MDNLHTIVVSLLILLVIWNECDDIHAKEEEKFSSKEFVNKSKEKTTNAKTQGKEEDILELATWDDATWILTSAFIIFTMQSGFGLLEAGSVSGKNEVNIMVKNAMDVIFGGITFWIFGFGIAFGEDPGSNAFSGVGYWFVDSTDKNMGFLFSTYVFQLSFATTATTIVSGCMAERTKLPSYIIFSFFNTICYVLPAHWVWGKDGFLKLLGVIDFAGSGVVHLLGGSSGICASMILGPRTGRYEKGYVPPTGNPTNCILGMFILWWGWVGFNCGSTFGIAGIKWKLAAKTAATTFNASCVGGCVGVLISWFKNGRKKFDVPDMVNSVLGALVAITASCPIVSPFEATIIGALSAPMVIFSVPLINWLKIDDPVSAIAVHGVGGMWGLLATGLFAKIDPIADTTMGRNGLFHGGGFYLFGVELLAGVVILTWGMISTWCILWPIKKIFGLRLSEVEELLGSDICEHDVNLTQEELEELGNKLMEMRKRKKEIKKRENRRLSIKSLSDRKVSVISLGGEKASEIIANSIHQNGRINSGAHSMITQAGSIAMQEDDNGRENDDKND